MLTEIVDAFHRTAQLKRTDIFEDDRHDPIANHADSATPSPGWIGANYRPGGVLMIGINPGGGTDTYQRNPSDDRLYESLRAFRDARGTDRESRLADASHIWIALQRTHNVRRIIDPVLAAAGVGEAFAVLRDDLDENARQSG